MKLKLAFWLIAAFVIAVPAAADLSDYPEQFMFNGEFDGQIIVGKGAPASDVLAASEIAVALQQLSSSRLTAYTDAEFSNGNAILIGLPCDNSVTASILGTKACNLGLERGEGWLRLIEEDGNTYLIVSGHSAADTRKAARFIATADGMSGSELRVSGTLDSPEAIEAEPLEIKQEIPEPEAEVPALPAAPSLPEASASANISADIEAKPQPEIAPQQPSGQSAKQEIPTNLPAPQPPKQNIIAKIISFFRSIFS